MFHRLIAKLIDVGGRSCVAAKRGYRAEEILNLLSVKVPWLDAREVDIVGLFWKFIQVREHELSLTLVTKGITRKYEFVPADVPNFALLMRPSDQQ